VAKDRWDAWFKNLLIGLAVTALALAVAAVVVVYLVVNDLTDAANAMARLKVVLSYEILILTFFYGLMVLLYMASGEIDLTMLLCEPKGNDKDGNPIYGASMSRFQLLIFTFVIALSLLLITIANGAKKFPAVPSEILVLLGISASTYAVGKGIQSSSSAAAADGATNGNGGNGNGGNAAKTANAANLAANSANSAANAANAAANAADNSAANAANTANTANAANTAPRATTSQQGNQ
jgi:hypothetical protein